ncbi:hypothetical protein [Porphyrobacter sp. AAP82]|uniref:hypothetical protein n=1 Tax=Porphyrobacter sp. AAP82 TaxID=1248917 RepID=UPI0002E27C0B|nr:hypothetical protein [Porphyrobacter sp. AAP82]
MKTLAPLLLAAASALVFPGVAAPLLARDTAPASAHTGTTPEATRGIGPGARPVGAH